jgi:glycosyltransferase involved in cell wall biosynthesis
MPPTDREMIAQRYLVNYPFILYAGAIRPHKNVVRIIEAFSALKSELQKEEQFPDLKLIIIGDDLSSHPRLRRTVVRSGVQNDVRFLGFVPIEVLRIFYDVAKIFVFPSLYEGFGLPPLEAMAHGTPVVTSNTSSLPEVAGNAALLVNPENVFEIRRGFAAGAARSGAARAHEATRLRTGATILLDGFGVENPRDLPRSGGRPCFPRGRRGLRLCVAGLRPRRGRAPV